MRIAHGDLHPENVMIKIVTIDIGSFERLNVKEMLFPVEKYPVLMESTNESQSGPTFICLDVSYTTCGVFCLKIWRTHVVEDRFGAGANPLIKCLCEILESNEVTAATWLDPNDDLN
uniref:Protein kinase domain-containing protein n=1 Tax=Acrobeloides nanus TaxID=290746 RepID=A0A914CJU6_9BILA